MNDKENAAPPLWRERLAHLPKESGVYLMRGDKGRVLYVGKANNLQQRVRSYFNRSGDQRFFIEYLPTVLQDIEVMVTSTEKEAVILESTLIKKHHPPFNVRLRDDKNFLWLRIELQARYPRVETVRKRQADGARYFGPFHLAGLLRDTLRVLNRHFQLRLCTDRVMARRQRPCLMHQIKRCLAPCVLVVDRETYQEHLDDAIHFLEGRHDRLVEDLKRRMQEAARALQFETAALYRDRLRAVEKTRERQRMVLKDTRDRDAFGLFREADRVEIQHLAIREGAVAGGHSFSFTGLEFPDEEVLSSFIALYYASERDIPSEVLVSLPLDDARALGEALAELHHRRCLERGSRSGRPRNIPVTFPQRGDRRRLIEMAVKNAATEYERKSRSREDTTLILQRLKRRLRLDSLPIRMECFDISNIMGREAVGSMVTFMDGQPDKQRYRRYRVQASGGDYQMMEEVLRRRLKRGASEGDLPDLLVVDGGRAQLSAARSVLKSLGLEHLNAIGLAKARPGAQGLAENDRVYLPGAKNAVSMKAHSPELHLLQRIRDEAHRFAITYHRTIRSKHSLGSTLETVPGIGPRRRQALLKHFGSLKRLKEASLEEMAALPGIPAPVARALFEAMQVAKD